MTIRPISRNARFGLPSTPLPGGLAGVALCVALSGCSSDGARMSSSAASAPAPGAQEGTPDDSADAPQSEDPSARDEPAAPGDAPESPSSEGQQVADLAPGENPDAPGASDPGAMGETDDPDMPDPDAEQTDPDVEEPGDGLDPAVPSSGCGTARTLPEGNQTIVSGGMNRTFHLSTPENYDSSVPHRVIFMFHWNYGSINAIVNPPDADRNTDLPFYGMGELRDDETIFVVPQGLISPTGGPGWENANNRDVIFTDDMLEAISSDLCVDTSRVFATGFSYGAGMSYKLACVRAEQFRAAVVYNAGPISGNNPAECTEPIAFFQSHGVNDPILSYPTGLSVFNVFTELNGCTAMTPPNPPQDGHACVSYEGCSLPTRFCNFGPGQGNPFNTSLQGHYPSAKDPGETVSWIPREAWSFITQF